MRVRRPATALDELEALVASKMHLIPRYRQRVRTVPFELGRPVWVDDPDFDLGYHVRHTALPAPGDDAAFCRLMGRLMSQDLDRDRPLWEAWLVEGLDGGRWALVFKVHHCMVDGIAGVGLLTALLDLAPDVRVGEPRAVGAAPEPPGAVKVLDAWGGLAGDLAGVARGVPGVGRPPRPHPSGRRSTATGDGPVHRAPVAHRALSIEGPIGPHRVWAHSSASLAAVKTVRTAFGGTVNDVVLAAVSGGYRALLPSGATTSDGAVVRSLVPVSTRHEDGQRRARQPGVGALHRPAGPHRRPGGAPRGRPGPDGRAEGVGDRRGRRGHGLGQRPGASHAARHR